MVLITKPEEKIPLGRPTCKWEDNIKIALQEARRGSDVAQDRDRLLAIIN
jgi:hypothetical protein